MLPGVGPATGGATRRFRDWFPGRATWAAAGEPPLRGRDLPPGERLAGQAVAPARFNKALVNLRAGDVLVIIRLSRTMPSLKHLLALADAASGLVIPEAATAAAESGQTGAAQAEIVDLDIRGRRAAPAADVPGPRPGPVGSG